MAVMSYSLATEEPLAEGFRRIVEEQLQMALSMARSVEDPDLSVHGIRKTCKRMRALLRLIRGGFDNPEWDLENIAFRDLSRLLRFHRESAVRLKTLATLDGPDTGLREAATKDVRDHHRTVATDLAEAATRLEALESRVRLWPYDEIEQPVLEAGLRRIAGNGKKALRNVKRELTSEQLHEWRKHVKYLWYAIRLWVGQRPHLDPLRISLEQLSDLLGTEHDLADLRAYARGLDDPYTRPLEGMIRDRQSALRAQILDIGRPLFAGVGDRG